MDILPLQPLADVFLSLFGVVFQERVVGSNAADVELQARCVAVADQFLDAAESFSANLHPLAVHLAVGCDKHAHFGPVGLDPLEQLLLSLFVEARQSLQVLQHFVDYLGLFFVKFFRSFRRLRLVGR